MQQELRRSGFEEECAAGIVLTGSSSKMEGVVELAEEIFHTPVRLGVPQHVSGHGELMRNPIHATGVGLLIYGLQARLKPQVETIERQSETGMFRKIADWIRNTF